MAKSIRVVEKKLQHRKADNEERVYGIAFEDKSEVHIDPRQKAWQRMDTLIHEVIHVSSPDMTEKQVRKMTYAIRRVLWREGYRRSEMK